MINIIISFILLGSLPNSQRKIEPELMRRLMAKAKINDIVSSGLEVKGLDLLDNRSSVGSLSDADEFSTEEMYRFLMNSKNILESPVTGSENFPGKFLPPHSNNVHLEDSIHDRLVEYYQDTYVNLTFRKPFTTNLPDSIIVNNKVSQYGRCQIGAEIFGSATSARHIKSSFILAKFVNRDGRSIDTYPSQVQYFFEHDIYLSSQNRTHKLAYVRWYKAVNSHSTRFHFSINDDAETSNAELWENGFFPISRDCIIPIHNILSRFIPVKYKASNRSNAREYLAVVPLNRKFHLG